MKPHAMLLPLVLLLLGAGSCEVSASRLVETSDYARSPEKHNQTQIQFLTIRVCIDVGSYSYSTENRCNKITPTALNIERKVLKA
jgi:hypothetical protein